MERRARETSLHQSVSVTGDGSEWSPNLPKDRRAACRLVVPWPRHVSELSFLREFHNEYGLHKKSSSLGQCPSNSTAVCSTAAQLRAYQHTTYRPSNTADSPCLCVSARPIWHSRMQLHVSMWARGSAGHGGTVGGDAEMWTARAAIGPCAF